MAFNVTYVESGVHAQFPIEIPIFLSCFGLIVLWCICHDTRWYERYIYNSYNGCSCCPRIAHYTAPVVITPLTTVSVVNVSNQEIYKSLDPHVAHDVATIIVAYLTMPCCDTCDGYCNNCKTFYCSKHMFYCTQHGRQIIKSVIS